MQNAERRTNTGALSPFKVAAFRCSAVQRSIGYMYQWIQVEGRPAYWHEVARHIFSSLPEEAIANALRSVVYRKRLPESEANEIRQLLEQIDKEPKE